MRQVRTLMAALASIVLAAGLAGCGAVRSEQGKAGIDDVVFSFKNGNLTQASIVSGQEACERRVVAREKPEGGVFVKYETWATRGFRGQIARTELGKAIGENIANLPWKVILKQLPLLRSADGTKGVTRCHPWAPGGA